MLPDDNHPSNGDHGTHVGGIIAGRKNGVGSVGVAPEAEVMLCHYLWESEILDCVDYADDYGVRVINYSASAKGNPDTTLWANIMGSMKKNDMLMATSAGNDGQNIESFMMRPQSKKYDNLIAVGSLMWKWVLRSATTQQPTGSVLVLQYKARRDRRTRLQDSELHIVGSQVWCDTVTVVSH